MRNYGKNFGVLSLGPTLQWPSTELRIPPVVLGRCAPPKELLVFWMTPNTRAPFGRTIYLTVSFRQKSESHANGRWLSASDCELSANRLTESSQLMLIMDETRTPD
jgi:hypothetical protein